MTDGLFCNCSARRAQEYKACRHGWRLQRTVLCKEIGHKKILSALTVFFYIEDLLCSGYN